MNNKLDVVGIGNAMVDAIIPSNKTEIEKHDINRDSMNLIDENLKNNLHESYSIKEMVGGGSLGNSMFGITSFGGNGSFIGKIKNDEVGVFLQKDMVREGLQFPLGFTSPDISTGCCTIFVEEDGTRTMCTFLGAGTLIGPDDINDQHIKNHKIAYLEGYLWDNENAKKAMKKMVDICKADNQKIAFTLSDLFCVDRHRDSFKELIVNDIDILFANEIEAKAIVAFTETGRTPLLISNYRPEAPIFTMTTIDKTYNQMNLLWGVQQIKIDRLETTPEMFEIADTWLQNNKNFKKNDKVVIVAGTPPNKEAATNLIRVMKIGEF